MELAAFGYRDTARWRDLRYAVLACCIVALLLPQTALANVILQQPLEPGVVAAIRGGHDIHIEC